MKAKSSIHIAKGSLGYLSHNDRTRATKNSIFSNEKNECTNDHKTALKIYRQELSKRAKAYSERTGKALHKNTVTHLSAIVNLNAHHSLDDVKKVADYLEETLGTKVFQIAVHRDEGHIENGEAKKNYHAHIEFIGLDANGASVRKKLDRKYLSTLQTKVAELLKMERGRNYIDERAPRPKRLDTYEYKEHKKREELSVKSLKAEISQLRQQMKDAGIFTKEDYDALSAIKKMTKKDTLKEAAEILDNFIRSAQEKIATLQSQNKQLHAMSIAGQEAKKRYTAQREKSERLENELIEAHKTILKQKATIESQKAKIEELEAKIEELEVKLKERSTMRERQAARKDLQETKKALKAIILEGSNYHIELFEDNKANITIKQFELDSPQPSYGEIYETVSTIFDGALNVARKYIFKQEIEQYNKNQRQRTHDEDWGWSPSM